MVGLVQGLFLGLAWGWFRVASVFVWFRVGFSARLIESGTRTPGLLLYFVWMATAPQTFVFFWGGGLLLSFFFGGGGGFRWILPIFILYCVKGLVEGWFRVAMVVPGCGCPGGCAGAPCPGPTSTTNVPGGCPSGCPAGAGCPGGELRCTPPALSPPCHGHLEYVLQPRALKNQCPK